MTALIRYHLALTVHAQRYLGPLLLHLCALTIFTVNDFGPLTGSYVVAAGSLLLASCWLTVSILNQEGPARRAVTTVTAGGPARVLAAETTLALMAGLALTVIGTIFPIVSGTHEVTPAALTVGVLAQTTTLATGVAVGLICSRLVIPRPGYSLLLALLVVMALPLTPGLPPVNPLLRVMSSDRTPTAQLPAAAGALLLALALLTTSALLTHRIATRRS